MSNGSPSSRAPLSTETDARNAVLLRRCVQALIVAGSLCVLIAVITQGLFGFWGSLIGAVMVVVFFGVDVLVLRATRFTPPIQVLAVVAMVYLLKITLLAIFLVTLRGTSAFSVEAFGATVIVLTLVALGAAVVLVAKREVPLVEPMPAPLEASPDPGPQSPEAPPPASVES